MGQQRAKIAAKSDAKSWQKCAKNCQKLAKTWQNVAEKHGLWGSILFFSLNAEGSCQGLKWGAKTRRFSPNCPDSRKIGPQERLVRAEGKDTANQSPGSHLIEAIA